MVLKYVVRSVQLLCICNNITCYNWYRAQGVCTLWFIGKMKCYMGISAVTITPRFLIPNMGINISLMVRLLTQLQVLLAEIRVVLVCFYLLKVAKF